MSADTTRNLATEAETRSILARASQEIGLNPDGASLMRLGSNAVYRLASPVVARVAYANTAPEAADRTVKVARWLESVGYPAVRAIPGKQPVIIDGHPVTFWESISDGEQYATIDQVADVIARLHKLVPPDDLRLPELDPLANADRRIAESQWLTEDDRAWMTAELARHRTAYANLDFALPQGVIHGDANIGNVLRDDEGNPVVIDLDDFCIGPREWDLIQTALFYDRIGWHTHDEYETFASVYCYDITHWPGYPALADIREFVMVTWIISKADENDRTSAEASKRLTALRTGASRKDWGPF